MLMHYIPEVEGVEQVSESEGDSYVGQQAVAFYTKTSDWIGC